MKPVIILAYDGEFDIARAVAALTAAHRADVVTLTLDIGQSRDVQETRDAAIAAGAVRAHVVDALDDFARACVLPVLRDATEPNRAAQTSSSLAYPLIARRLAEIARIEETRDVVHGGGDALDAAIRAVDPSLHVARIDPVPMAVPQGRGRSSIGSARHLLHRPVADPAVARGVAANVEIQFDDAVPVAINGVPLALPELVESLSLIGGQHGIGHAEASPAPAALVLDAAYRALDRPSGVVRLELLDGRHRVLSAAGTEQLVNHA